MRKFIFLLILLFPTFAFGQSYAGNYRAIFFNLFSEPKTIIVEFEVKQDNSLNGKIKLGDEIKGFGGTVDKKGRFEAVIEQVGNFSYKLKGKIDKDNKISLVQRNQVGSGLNKSVSESSLEGNFSKVAKPVEKVENNFPQTKVELIDNGKSWLKIEHSNPIFGNEWTDFSAKIISKMNGNTDSWEIQIVKAYADGDQKITFLFPKFSGNTKIWKSDYLDLISYIEKKVNSGRNSFVSYADIYKKNPQLGGGTLELSKETESQMIFKISNFKIKRVAKDDFVTFNGFVYADKLQQ